MADLKILVAIKRVADTNVRVRVKLDGSGMDLSNVKMTTNPFDEVAVEEAVRQKEAGRASEVVLVSIGRAMSLDSIRGGLAMGADRGILVETDAAVEPLGVAKVLKALVARELPDLVILGKQATDDDCGQTGQMLAALLGWPQATSASRIVIEGGDAVATREVDGGRETVRLKLPAVVTVDLRLNEPRFVSLPDIMRAKKKRIDVHSANDVGADLSPRLKILKTADPPVRRSGVRVHSVEELVSRLRNEAGVLP